MWLILPGLCALMDGLKWASPVVSFARLAVSWWAAGVLGWLYAPWADSQGMSSKEWQNHAQFLQWIPCHFCHFWLARAGHSSERMGSIVPVSGLTWGNFKVTKQ